MVWLHSLKCMNEEPSTLEINGSCLGENAALDLAPRPKTVSHGAPWFAWVCAKVAGAVLSDNKSRCRLCDFEVDNALLVCLRLDNVTVSIV